MNLSKQELWLSVFDKTSEKLSGWFKKKIAVATLFIAWLFSSKNAFAQQQGNWFCTVFPKDMFVPDTAQIDLWWICEAFHWGQWSDTRSVLWNCYTTLVLSDTAFSVFATEQDGIFTILSQDTIDADHEDWLNYYIITHNDNQLPLPESIAVKKLDPDCEGDESWWSEDIITLLWSPLPVELAEHDLWYDWDAAVISWVTLSEIDNDKFVISRMNPGSNKRDAIRSVSWAWTSQQRNEYEILDPIKQWWVYHYKITQIDFDWDQKEKILWSVAVPFEKTLYVSPNPVWENITFRYTGKEQIRNCFITWIDWLIHCIDPREILWWTIDVSYLPAGYYTFTIQDSKGQKQTVKILKQ